MNTGTPKKILFLDAYFLPENTSYTHLENDLIEGLIESGYSVHVVCPRPTRNVSDEAAKDWKREEMLFEGRVHVTRFPVLREKKNPILRAFRYFLCNRRTYRQAKRIRDVDAIFCNSTPPIQGLIARKLKRYFQKKYHREIPFIYNLQDVFPDSLAGTGLAKKDSLLWKIGRKIENKTYAVADHIIVISESFKQNIMAKGVPEEKITVVYNWVDTDSVKPVPKTENPLYEKLNLDPQKFYVVYAGNFGVSQGIGTILKAAEILKEEKNISFLLFGGGAEYEKIRAEAKQMGLPNVTITKLLPAERTSQVYGLGDVCIVSCKKGAGMSAMPSKTWSILACNRPVVASFDRQSELETVLTKAHAGVCVEPQDPDALAKEIFAFYSAASEGNSYSSQGRAFVEANAAKNACAGKYVAVIQRYTK